MQPDQHPVVPREIITFPPGETVTYDGLKADHPWLAWVRLYLKGGDATQEDGSAGHDGHVIVELYDKTGREGGDRAA